MQHHGNQYINKGGNGLQMTIERQIVCNTSNIILCSRICGVILCGGKDVSILYQDEKPWWLIAKWLMLCCVSLLAFCQPYFFRNMTDQHNNFLEGTTFTISKLQQSWRCPLNAKEHLKKCNERSLNEIPICIPPQSASWFTSWGCVWDTVLLRFQPSLPLPALPPEHLLWSQHPPRLPHLLRNLLSGIFSALPEAPPGGLPRVPAGVSEIWGIWLLCSSTTVLLRLARRCCIGTRAWQKTGNNTRSWPGEPDRKSVV